MYRLAALTLIPLCLIGAVLPRAHSHAAVGPSDVGDSRAHVHLSGGHEHAHDHRHDGEHHAHAPHAESQESAHDAPRRGSSFSPPEHHQDAIYLSDFVSSGRIGAPEKVVVLSITPLVVERVGALPALARARASGARAGGPSSLFEPLPIYLAHASLRL